MLTTANQPDRTPVLPTSLDAFAQTWRLTERALAIAVEATAMVGTSAATADRGGTKSPARTVRSIIDGLPADPAFRPLIPGTEVDVVLAAVAVLATQLGAAVEDPALLGPKFAAEVRHGFIPLLKQLGMWRLKRLAEDALFYLEFPTDYQETVSRLLEMADAEHAANARRSGALREGLGALGIRSRVVVELCGVMGAARRQAAARGRRFAGVDLFRFHVLVDDWVSCYAALAALHSIGTPEPGTFLDNIALPRANGLCALCTSLVLPAPERGPHGLELLSAWVQTDRLYELAVDGLAAPWVASTIRNGVELSGPEQRALAGFRGLLATRKDGVKSGRTGAGESITVFSRPTTKSGKSNVWQLRAGSTVLDLAYRIHTEVGDRARAASVGGQPRPLLDVLRHGDHVELDVASETVRTVEDADGVSTAYARRNILHAVSAQSRGRRMIAAYLRGVVPSFEDWRLDDNLLSLTLKSNALEYQSQSISDVSSLLEAVAASPEGKKNPNRLISAASVGAQILLQLRGHGRDREPPTLTDTPSVEWVPTTVDGEPSPLPVRFCRSCRPSPGTSIVGIERLAHMRVHDVDCPRIHSNVAVALTWTRLVRTVHASVRLDTRDRAQLVHDLTEVIYNKRAGVNELHAVADGSGGATITVDFFTRSAIALAELLDALHRVPSVRSVVLESSSLPSKVKDIFRTHAHGRDTFRALNTPRRDVWQIEPLPMAIRVPQLVLPYNPQQPAHSSSQFFGREAEKHRLDALVSDRLSGAAIVTGPRRIGKTSLALRFLDGIDPATRPALIRIDLRSTRSLDAQHTLRAIAKSISVAFGRPGIDLADDYGQVVIDQLERADRHIVLVLDELGVIIEKYATGRFGIEYFDWLRSLFDRSDHQLPVTVFLLMPPDALHTYFQVGLAETLGPIPVERLGTLDRRPAIEMITLPFHEAGVAIDDEAAAHAAQVAGAHPFFIILLLQAVARLVNARPRNRTLAVADVDRAVADVLAAKGIFEFFEDAVKKHPLAASTLAAFVEAQGSTNVLLAPPISDTNDGAEGSDVWDWLAFNQVLSREISPERVAQFRFTVPMFRDWLVANPSAVRTAV